MARKISPKISELVNELWKKNVISGFLLLIKCFNNSNETFNLKTSENIFYGINLVEKFLSQFK